jgi:hypothetical protein
MVGQEKRVLRARPMPTQETGEAKVVESVVLELPEPERLYQLDRRGPKGRIGAKLSFETRKDMREQGVGQRAIRILNLLVRLEHLLKYEYAKLPLSHRREIQRLHRALARVYMRT